VGLNGMSLCCMSSFFTNTSAYHWICWVIGLSLSRVTQMCYSLDPLPTLRLPWNPLTPSLTGSSVDRMVLHAQCKTPKVKARRGTHRSIKHINFATLMSVTCLSLWEMQETPLKDLV
jgi:hypothetical protein